MNIETIKGPFWGAVGGALLISIVGFSWGGWITGSKAKTMEDAAASTAVLARLIPICVNQYNQDANKVVKHAELMAKNKWDRSDYVAEQGWSMIPGEEEIDSKISRKCAEALSDLKTG